MIYLDHNATTQPSARVIDAMTRALTEHWQNPSSLHLAGQAVRREVDRARLAVADLIGARAPEVVFTGSGTESLDLAIRGTLASTSRRTIITTPMEHGALRATVRSLAASGDADLTWAPLTCGGCVDVDRLDEMLTDDVALVSIQWANNETGCIQPIEQIGERCRRRRITFHCDATQWVGKMPTNVGTAPDQHGRPPGVPVDMLTFAGHKFHGPKGIGVLWIRRGCRIKPVIHGTQELSRRGGTENTPAIIGLGVAAEEAAQWLSEADAPARAAQVRDRFERGVQEAVPGAVVNAPPHRVWSTASIAFPGIDAEALLLSLSESGVCASAGSACASGSIDPSPVLCAAGVEPCVAEATIRFSICRETSERDVDHAVAVIARCTEAVRESLPALQGSQDAEL